MAYSLIAHTLGSPSNQDSVTTSAIDTSGANLLLYGLNYYNTFNGISSLTDSKGNVVTASQLIGYAENQVDSSARMITEVWAVLSPIVGAGHTVTAGFASSFTLPTVVFSAWAGAPTSALVDIHDPQWSNAFYPSSNIYGGGGTPSQNNELILATCGFDARSSTVPTVDSGLIALDGGVPGGFGRGIAWSYEIQTTATARGLTWHNVDYITFAQGCAIFLALKAAATGAAFMPSAPLIVPQARKRAAFF